MRNKKTSSIHLTKFELDVLRAVSTIPSGETRTYKEIANAIGRKGAARAVGNALRKNPYPVTIPCHRVIRKDGSLGGYSLGKNKKEELLRKEKS